MTEPPEHAGQRRDHDLVTPGVTTHAVTDGDDHERDPAGDVVGAPPRDAAAAPAEGSPAHPDAPDDADDAVTRQARRTTPGQEFGAGEGGSAGGA